MAISIKEPKTSHELGQMIADLSGVRPNVIAVHKIGQEGSFGATVIGGIMDPTGGEQQSNIEAICDRLRLRYRLRD
jgi:hypothetical protein